MKVSVVIPAFNEEKRIALCLQSVKGQIEPADEIIVVDNNSTDKTKEIAKSFNVTVLEEKKQGIIPTRNTGFDKAKGDIIARTDADSKVPPDWIKKIKQHFEQDPLLLGLSGTAHFYDALDIIQSNNWPGKIVNQLQLLILKQNGMFGFNMAIKKSAWNKIRSELCTNDKEVHEDIDLAIHLAEHGKVLFDENLVVESSFRRFKRFQPYFEYPKRYVNTIEVHKKWLKKLRKATSIKNAIEETQKSAKKIIEKTQEFIS